MSVLIDQSPSVVLTHHPPGIDDKRNEDEDLHVRQPPSGKRDQGISFGKTRFVEEEPHDNGPTEQEGHQKPSRSEALTRPESETENEQDDRDKHHEASRKVHAFEHVFSSCDLLGVST